MVELTQLTSNLDPDKMTNEEAKIRFELACNDYIREPNKEAFDFVAQNGHRFSILEFVQLLQHHITSKEDDVRLNAITLLVDVSLMSSLKESEVSVLVQFLCGRLSDKYNIVPKILTGLMCFVKEHELEPSTACQIARAVFKSVDVQALHQDTRFKAYCLINSLLHRNLLCVLEGMNNEFVVSYINLIDGEQDPRNLMLIFTMTVIVLQHFNIDNVEETMFDVISCYYPIDFTPPEESAVSVTPQELRARVNNCFKANNKLAKHAIPFLLEKFSSSVMQTRLQSCETLKLCLISYGISCSEDLLILVWNEIKQEIFGGINKDLREMCLVVISSLFWVLTIPNVKNKALDPTQFIGLVFDYCKEKLSYSELKYLRPTALILVAIVKSSGAGSGLVAEHCLDWFTDRFVQHAGDADGSVRHIILDEMVTLLCEMQCGAAKASAAVTFFKWQKLEDMFLKVISEKESPELCTTGLCGVSELLNIYHMTEQQKVESAGLDIEQIVLGVYNHLSSAHDEGGLQILTVISREYPELVNRLLLDKLLNKVDEGDPSARRMLSRLLVDTLLIQHSPRLVKLFTEKGDIEIISLLTVALSYQESLEVVTFCQQFIFYQLLNYLIQLAVQEKDIEQAVLLFQEFTVALYKNRSPRTVDMMVFTQIFTKSALFQPFSSESAHQQTMLTAIYASVLTFGSHESTFDPLMCPLDLTAPLKLACVSSDPVTVRSLAAVIGLMVNRMDEGSHLDDLKSLVFTELESCHVNINNKVWLCIRVCQGLVYRWDSSAEQAVKLFMECLTDNSTHLHTAHLTGHVLEPLYQGNRMVLYKQRFLLTLIPLITPFTSNPSLLQGDVWSSVVRGVGTLLLSLPQSLISTHGDTLYPVILNNLTPATCDSASLKLVQYLITNVPAIIVMHLDTLVRRLCELSALRAVSVRCRVEAVRTLQTCTTQLHHKHTHVQREYVVKQLRVVLGDRKRVVRQIAAETIQSWILLQP